MFKKLTTLFVICFVAAFSGQAKAQYIYTASGKIIHTQEALTDKKGALILYNGLDFYTAANSFSNGSQPVSLWDVRNTVHIDYGISDRVQISVNPRIYEDVSYPNVESNSPLDDIILTAKVGSIPFSNDYFYTGGFLTVLIPVGKYHNSFANPYSAGSTEIGVNGMLSFYADNLFPRESFSAHLNVGYYNYFDKNKDISHNSNPYLVGTNSSAINYAIGFRYPTSFIDLLAEFWGNNFVQAPPEIAYTRKSTSYLTAGFKLKPFAFASLDLTADIQVGGKDTTNSTNFNLGSKYAIYPDPPTSPVNTATWRINLGIQLNILPLSSYASTRDPRNIDLSPENQGAEILRKLETVEDEKDVTSRKVDELRTRRQEVEHNLQQLKQLLRDSDAPSAPALVAPPPTNTAPTDTLKQTPKK
jgi:hypothetical protein